MRPKCGQEENWLLGRSLVFMFLLQIGKCYFYSKAPMWVVGMLGAIASWKHGEVMDGHMPKHRFPTELRNVYLGVWMVKHTFEK